MSQTVEESLAAKIDRLSRERPKHFKTRWAEIVFVFSIVMSQFLTEYFVSGFTVVLPTLIRELDIPRATSVWPATAFSLVIASTLLVFGRLGDMYGGSVVYISGLLWLLVWSTIAGFSINPLMLIFCRAIQGFGAAAMLPSGVMLLGSLYNPGPRKNLVFAIYGMLGIFGFFGGIAIAGVAGQYLGWGYYFWIGAMLTGVTLVSSWFSVRHTQPKADHSSLLAMDYPGAVTIIVGLTLTIFAITQSAHASSGWKTPYIPVCLVLGILSLGLATYVEGHIAQHPLLPASIFAKKHMKPLCIALLFLYGTWGIFSVYGTLYFQDVMGATPIQVVAWYIPLGIAGLILSILEGFILHLVPGKVLLVLSGVGALGSQLLLALIPIENGSYWPWIFPATILSTIGIDLATILMTVFVTTVFSYSQQGLAGGVVNSVLQLGVAFCLGIADIIQSATIDSAGLATSYKNTFWFGVAAGAISLIVLTVFANVPKATAELTADEKETLMREAVSTVEPLPEQASNVSSQQETGISQSRELPLTR